MGQVLTFPTLKVASRSSDICLKKSSSSKTDNVLLFAGVFVEYHDKIAVPKRAGALSWMSCRNTPPRREKR